jgi:hypothetical protein
MKSASIIRRKSVRNSVPHVYLEIENPPSYLFPFLHFIAVFGRSRVVQDDFFKKCPLKLLLPSSLIPVSNFNDPNVIMRGLGEDDS